MYKHFYSDLGAIYAKGLLDQNTRISCADQRDQKCCFLGNQMQTQ